MSDKSTVEIEIEGLLRECRELNFEKRREAKAVAEKVISMSKAGNLPVAHVKGLVWLATIACDTFSEYDNALKICDEALILAEQLKAPDLLVRVYSTYGVCYHYMGDLQTSHKNYLQAITIAEDKVNNTPEEREGVANLYYNVAVLFKTEDFSHLRQTYLENALRIYEQNDFKLGLSRCYNAYSAFHAQQKDYEQALTFQKKALLISEEINDRHGVSIYNNNIGSMYIEMKNFEAGMVHLQLALKQKTEIGNKHSIAVSHMHLGMAYKEMGNIDDAIREFRLAENFIGEINSKIFLNEIYEHLTNVYALKGDFENAFWYQKKFIETNKEALNFDKTAAVYEAEAKFEAEKKHRENTLLLQKKTEIEEYAKRLEASNNELKQFAHVASHDLREPLRMISSYIALVERKAAQKLNEEELQFLQFAVDGAKRMDALISDLLELSKLSSVLKSETVDLNKIVGETIFSISENIKELRAEVTFDKLPNITGDKTQMFQLFQNLITNGLKYNRSDKPQVHISYELKVGCHIIRVADNGIGIPAEHRERIFVLFQRLHSRNEYSGTGIGLAICRKIVEQMNGSVQVEENQGGGSVFVIRIPLK